MNRNSLLATIAVTHAVLLAAAASAAQTDDSKRVFLNVGGAINRDLPPPKLIPDALAPPKGAAEGHPPGLQFRRSALGLIYTDAAGKTLYQMRVSGLRFRNDQLKYCVGRCAELFAAVAAPADAKPIGAWKVVAGAQGPQWGYGNNAVFTYTGDKKPGDLNGHEFEDMFLAINYIPPVPKLATPANVAPLFLNHSEYVLADGEKRPLYAYANLRDCKAACVKLEPFAAGMASRTVGEWTVVRSGERPQWAYRGKPVYVSQAVTPDLVDRSAVLRP